ncbi:phage tail protein [Aggregicoccus sp. 17bor-14]|uniref:phage tail protein n=1 Tax=Myxococcaceae TaxID=31 RepID=UPI00129C940C|nr:MULTISPECIES: tail fiber protein [Myxococcaceae]MBF5040970.1 phage tail protein [Simulacricoccus sp. 17bor-14]MRI86758.1 phage tail protein [Aggregicoccus sp. 17bor-14]
MADPFVAEIRMMPFNFAPKGWAFCDGQILPLSQNTALFSLLGTTYGGDGKSNFALPNLQGNVPMHPGQGPGLSLHNLGETGGSQTVSLLQSEIPAHTHALMGSSLPGEGNDPGPSVVLASPGAVPLYNVGSPGPVQPTTLAPQALTPAGGDQPHNNMMPYLTVNFCIALQGVYPPRT